MRKITEIIIHCSATTEGKDFSVEILIAGIASEASTASAITS